MADFKALETFLWVVTLGSFRGAAQKLNTTQPVISQGIAQLEREMGIKLWQRDRRSAAPTPSGRQMMVYAEKLIGLRSEMLAVVGGRSAMRGVLRLGVAETIVHTATAVDRSADTAANIYGDLVSIAGHRRGRTRRRARRQACEG